MSSRRRSCTTLGPRPRRSWCALPQLGDGCSPVEHANRVGHSMLRRELPRFRRRRWSGRWRVHRRPRRHLCVGDAARRQLRADPGAAGDGQDVHRVRTSSARLVKAGKRVGVTAMSHHAIDNLMEAVVERLRRGRRPRRSAGGAQVDAPDRGDLDHVTYIDDNGGCASGDFNVVAGTPWFFASTAMRDNPVDVLVVDEAGQLGLADTLAATISAANVILLGDPQQLPQVSQASHPGGGGRARWSTSSATNATVPADRGVLLDVTWRMHPDVCKFISDTSTRAADQPRVVRRPVDGRRVPACAGSAPTTPAARPSHPRRPSSSPTTIGDLIGTAWTDSDGDDRPLTADDFIVVTPYNDQRPPDRGDGSPRSRDSPACEVGTVDKFQGREAAVVVFSMATSSKADMPRTPTSCSRRTGSTSRSAGRDASPT